MRGFLIAATAITLAVHAQTQHTAALSPEEIQQLEGTVAGNPGDVASLTLLGKNYALFILGITSLGDNDRVTAIDPGKAANSFAQHARDELVRSPFARVAAEGGEALWQYSTEVEVYQTLHPSSTKIDTTAAKTFGVQSIDQAIAMDPNNQIWRTYRIPILIFRSNFTHFMPLTASDAYRQVKQDMSVLTGLNRTSMLANAAKLAVKAGEWEAGRGYAQEMLKSSPGPNNWNYGNAIYVANTVLGQIALRQGSIEDAKAHLVAAGKTPGSPPLNTFGPNMSLAKDLFQAGERGALLAFFDECRAFWKMDRGQLQEWADQVNSNRMPDFGANLLY